MLPNIPTLDELGYRNFDHSAFVGLLAPRETPRAVIDKLNKALNEAITTRGLAEKLSAFGMTIPRQPNTPESYAAFMATQIANQRELAKLSAEEKKP